MLFSVRKVKGDCGNGHLIQHSPLTGSKKIKHTFLPGYRSIRSFVFHE